MTNLSDALVKLVSETAPSTVCVKAGAYRTVSGVVIDTEHIAVPDHALKRRDGVSFLNHSGEETAAKILGRDPSVDLAILHVQDHQMAALPQAQPTSLKAGMLAAVVGMTRDIGASVSLGILGAVGPQRRTWRGGSLDQFVRLDVSLYPSQNGAAVITSEGQLIGMATPALSRHATITVPINTIHRVIAELHKEGRIRRGHLGVGVQPVVIPDSLRSKIEGSPALGLILLSVASGAAADAAGLQVGDILLSLNGNSLEDIDQLQAQLRGEHIGQASELQILRGGEPRRVSVVIQEVEKKQA